MGVSANQAERKRGSSGIYLYFSLITIGVSVRYRTDPREDRCLHFLTGFGFWAFVLPPGQERKIDSVHRFLRSSLGCGLALLHIALVCGFARDIGRKPDGGEASCRERDSRHRQ